MATPAPDRWYPSQAGLSGRHDVDAGSIATLPFLRSVLAPEYATLPHAQLEAFMEGEYGEGAAEGYDEYLESIFGSIAKFASKAAPVVANIAGGVVKGASSGAALGPFGMIGGGLAGGVGQGFASYGKGPLRDIGMGLNTGLSVAGQLSPTGRIGASVGGALSGIGQGKNVLHTALGAASGMVGGGSAGGALGSLAGLAGGRGGALAGLLGGGKGGGPAGALAGLLGGGRGSKAGMLMGLLQDPNMLRALGAMTMGSNGLKSIPVGSAKTPVPPAAFANLLGLFAQSAVDEQAELADGSELRYLMDDTGEWLVDPAESDERAGRLLDLLNMAALERLIVTDQQAQWDQLQHQQQLLQQAAAHDQMRQLVGWQRQVEQENALYDAMDLADAYEMAEYDDAGEPGEHDALEAMFEAEFAELDEYDEAAYA